jgi:hypothetical protein
MSALPPKADVSRTRQPPFALSPPPALRSAQKCAYGYEAFIGVPWEDSDDGVVRSGDRNPLRARSSTLRKWAKARRPAVRGERFGQCPEPSNRRVRAQNIFVAVAETLYQCGTFDTQKFRQAKASFPRLGRLKKD